MARKKSKAVQRKHWLLFAGGSFAALAFVFWQTWPSATIPGARAPLQLTLSAPPESVQNVAAYVVSKDAAAVTPVKKAKSARTSKPASPKPASSKNTQRVATRLDASPVRTAERVENRTESAVAPAVAVAPKSSAVSFEAKARASLEKRDYDEARDHIESALARGGKATFTIVHDHSRGNFESDDPAATCVGQLTIHADEIRFEPRHGDGFAARWAEVREVGANRFFGSGRGGFHVSVNTGGKYKNFNLAPESKEKAEAKLILDLLNSYTRAADRSK